MAERNRTLTYLSGRRALLNVGKRVGVFFNVRVTATAVFKTQGSAISCCLTCRVLGLSDLHSLLGVSSLSTPFCPCLYCL